VSEEDDADYRRRLSEVLETYGFGWVVQEAEAQIAEGKVSLKQVSEQETFNPAIDPMFVIRKPRRRRASLVTSEAYTEAEKLEILLRGIKAAIAERAQLEKEILHQLADVTAVEFQPDASLEEAELGYRGREHRLDRSMIEQGQNLQSRTEHAITAMMRRERGSPGTIDR
jgi:hypothetical protein